MAKYASLAGGKAATFVGTIKGEVNYLSPPEKIKDQGVILVNMLLKRQRKLLLNWFCTRNGWDGEQFSLKFLFT